MGMGFGKQKIPLPANQFWFCRCDGRRAGRGGWLRKTNWEKN